MARRTFFTALRGISLALLLAAGILAIFQYKTYQRSSSVFPAGSAIAGIPVGGLTRQQAGQRLTEAYAAPIELRYGDALIHLQPSEVDFQIALDEMLAAAGQSAQSSILSGFWNYLREISKQPVQVPLQASVPPDKIRTYLEDQIVPRYDQPALPPIPVVGTVGFHPGVAGSALDINRSIPLVEDALRSLTDRTVELPLETIIPPSPALEDLEILLKQTIDLHGFQGLVGLYLRHLEKSHQLSFAYQEGQTYPTGPDVAFTAASIMKIPIMVSVFRRLDGEPDVETDKLLRDMIQESGNEAADWVMQRIIDPDLAPLDVTDDLRSMGLEDTFLAGYFYQGAPILRLYETPANQRTDVFTDPDVYSQTTPSDMGVLLAAIYQCSQAGSGLLTETFPGEITQQECQSMLAYLAGNKTPYLIESGVPEIIDVIHKHGWVSFLDVINAIGDAALLYTPGGDYVLVIFTHHPDGLLWDPTSALVSDLSRAVYNFYNTP